MTTRPPIPMTSRLSHDVNMVIKPCEDTCRWTVGHIDMWDSLSGKWAIKSLNAVSGTSSPHFQRLVKEGWFTFSKKKYEYSISGVKSTHPTHDLSLDYDVNDALEMTLIDRISGMTETRQVTLDGPNTWPLFYLPLEKPTEWQWTETHPASLSVLQDKWNDIQASSQSGLLVQRAVVHGRHNGGKFVLNPVTNKIRVSPFASLSYIGFCGSVQDLPDRELQLHGTLTLVSTIEDPVR